MQSHSHHGEDITHPLARIAENISDTAVALEPSIAMLNADPSLREDSIGLFLFRSQFVFSFTLFFAFSFEWENDFCATDREALKAIIPTHLKLGRTRELRLIND